jgi:FkbM family methyltransferase
MQFVTAQRLCKYLPPIIASRVRLMAYSPRMAALDRKVITAKAQTGSILEGNTVDFHFYPFSIQGYYEFRNVAIALALAAPGETIVEIGANVGTETVSFSDVVGPRGTVHAFEPLRSNARWIQRANELSQNNNIVLHECAVGDANAPAPFSVPPEHSSGTGHLLGEGETTAASIVVNVVTLDSVSDLIGSATLMFIDIEGNELRFLRGAREFLARHRPVLVLEASPRLLQRRGATIEELYRMLRASGYRVYSVGRFRAGLTNPAKLRSAENWLCLPEERRRAINKVNRVLFACALLPCIRGMNPLKLA